MWKRDTPGCPCCVESPPCDSTVEVLVRGCYAVPLAGVTVVVKNGATTLASGTTNGSGLVTFVIATPVAITASVQVAAFGGFQAFSASVLLNCASRFILADLSVDSGHVCVACCADGYPVPKTLDLSTGAGDTTVEFHHRTGDNSYFWGEITVSVQKLTPARKTCCPGYDPMTWPCFDLASAFIDGTFIHAQYATVSSYDVTFKFALVCHGDAGKWIVYFAIYYDAACGDADCQTCLGDPVYGVGNDLGGSTGGSAFGFQTADNTFAYPVDGGGLDFSPSGGLILSGSCAAGVLTLSATMPDGPTSSLMVSSHCADEFCCVGDDCPDPTEADVVNPFAGTLAVSSP